ncbi:MAG: endonuclease III [Phycisphaerales bacterium]|nr:MAG: endonuclease III [Phycisphaerales bacterium]
MVAREPPPMTADVAPIKATPRQRERAARLLAALREAYPDARCELDYRTPHELLIATILSAQATDVSVNKATPALFKNYPTIQHLADATPEEIEPFIKAIGLYRNKAKSIHLAARAIVDQFAGQVPRTMPELLTFRGVARKTANVVLGNAFHINVGFVVDTHVQRLATRFALVKPATPIPIIERTLMGLFPQKSWCDASHYFIFHGRRVCTARGTGCADHAICKEFGTACDRRVASLRVSAPKTRARPSTAGGSSGKV